MGLLGPSKTELTPEEKLKASELELKKLQDEKKELEDQVTEEQLKVEELEGKLSEPKEVDLGDLTEFKVFRLRVKGFEGKGENKKKVLERDDNKHFKTCKLLQVQADELNSHSINTLIEYKEK